MLIVSDTSPISNLLKIDHLWLLKEIYQTVKPLLEDLEKKAGFWLGPKFQSEVLALANELL